MTFDRKVELFLEALQSQSNAYKISLSPTLSRRLAEYYQLLEQWNPRLHLVAPCPPREFAILHVLESLCLLRHFSDENRVVDVGSGGGLPIIPCLITRPGLKATLIESSKKKCVFLREVLKRMGIESSAEVIAERFEDVSESGAEFVTSRALDRVVKKLPALVNWAPSPSTLLLYGGNSLQKRLEELGIGFESELLPNSKQRFLFIVRK